MEIVGVDVHKKTLEWHSDSGHGVIDNDKSSIAKWLKPLPKETAIGLESTGGFGLLLATLAHKSDRTVYFLSPRQVAAHRRALGRRAKNDRLDAELIQKFVAVNLHDLRAYEPWAEPWRTLRDLVRLRTRLANDVSRIRLRAGAFGRSDAQSDKLVKSIVQVMTDLDREIEESLAPYEEAKCLRSIPGIGPLTCAALLPILMQHQFKSADAFIAYLGMDLIVSESGQQKGQRCISSWGDVTARHLLFLAGRSAANAKAWAPYKERTQEHWSIATQLHCAMARKVARVAFALVQSKQLFDPKKAYKIAEPTTPGPALTRRSKTQEVRPGQVTSPTSARTTMPIEESRSVM